jgi:hypothetical protein
MYDPRLRYSPGGALQTGISFLVIGAFLILNPLGLPSSLLPGGIVFLVLGLFLTFFSAKRLLDQRRMKRLNVASTHQKEKKTLYENNEDGL